MTGNGERETGNHTQQRSPDKCRPRTLQFMAYDTLTINHGDAVAACFNFNQLFQVKHKVQVLHTEIFPTVPK